MQLFLVMTVGLFVGRAFDTGYLYVTFILIEFLSITFPYSHHLMIGGSFLLVFCLFMLSITEADQYYQVKIKEGLRRPDVTFIRYF